MKNTRVKLTRAQAHVILDAGDVLFFTNHSGSSSYYKRENGMTSLINAKVFESLKKLGMFNVVKNTPERSDYNLSNKGLRVLNDLRDQSLKKSVKR